MAFKVFQSVIQRIRDAIGDDFGITDSSGVIIASTIEEEIGTVHDQCYDFLNSNATYIEKSDIVIKKIDINSRVDFVLYLLTDHPERKKIVEFISISLENAKLYYDENRDLVYLNIVLPFDNEKTEVIYSIDLHKIN